MVDHKEPPSAATECLTQARATSDRVDFAKSRWLRRPGTYRDDTTTTTRPGLVDKTQCILSSHVLSAAKMLIFLPGATSRQAAETWAFLASQWRCYRILR